MYIWAPAGRSNVLKFSLREVAWICVEGGCVILCIIQVGFTVVVPCEFVLLALCTLGVLSVYLLEPVCVTLCHLPGL